MFSYHFYGYSAYWPYHYKMTFNQKIRSLVWWYSLTWAGSLSTAASHWWRTYQWQEVCGLHWCGEVEWLSRAVSMLFMWPPCLRMSAGLCALTCVRRHVLTVFTDCLGIQNPCHSLVSAWRLPFLTLLYWTDENPLLFKPSLSVGGMHTQTYTDTIIHSHTQQYDF